MKCCVLRLNILLSYEEKMWKVKVKSEKYQQ